jgi:hypothetical protein
MQCIFNPHLRCKNTYFARDVETISCWSENKEFLELLVWHFSEDGVSCIPLEHLEKSKFKPPSNYMQIKHAEIYDWFNRYDDNGNIIENNIFILEPWIKSGALHMSAERLAQIKPQIYMDHRVCAVLRVAEWRFLDQGYKVRGK